MPSRHEEVSLGGRLYGQVALSGQGTSNFRGALKLNYTTNTNKSPQLVFAAAIVAASLQLFTLPGLTIESQQNSSQLGRADDVEIMYAQSNLNDFSWKTSIKSFLSIISVILSVINLYLILAKTNKLEKKHEELGTKIKQGLEDLKKDINQSIDNLKDKV